MVLTKQDLQEWNSHPVTRAVFDKIRDELDEAQSTSCVMPTVDQTALKTASVEGFIKGADSLIDAYEILLEDAE